MTSRFLVLMLRVFLTLLCVQSVEAAVIFQDGFEAEALIPAWTVSKTFDGRAVIRSEFVPSAGEKHLVLDDGVSDAVYSVAEATLQLDLSNKKNVVLSFKAKSLGNEPNTPPTGNFASTRAFDGVSVSSDGGATWRVVQSLANLGTSWESFSLNLDSVVGALGGSYGEGFRIRFSGYDNGPAPIDGIALDEIVITADEDQRAILEVPARLTEGDEPAVGYVLLAYAPTTLLTLNLSTSPSGHLTVPSTVTVPAGETFASFEIAVNDDKIVNLNRTVVVNATATGVTSTPGSVAVIDNDAPIVTLTLPAELIEGASPINNATVSLDRAAAVAITVNLAASPSGEVTLPASVTIPAGQTQVAFTARATDDTRIDGNIPVTVTATGATFAQITAQTTATDNETRTLSLTFPATAAQEGGSVTGTITISGTLTTPLAVSMGSSTEGTFTVPASVTIPAGQTQVTFTATAVDNTATDGTRTVSVTAAATAFTSASRTVTVRDNDAASYRFGSLSSIVNISSPVSITVTAFDIEDNAISGFSGVVNLSVVLPSGGVRALTPATVTLSGAIGWTGNVTVPSISEAPLRFRVSDAAGRSGESSSFDVMRVLSLTAADLAWDPVRSRIYASVPSSAGGTYANQVVTIDPSAAQISGGVTTGQDPGQFALTSGGENLYVALNGNGTISKINPATMTVAANFAVGTHASYGTLYAEDMCTVAGQPNVLVVSQFRKSVSPRHNGVAVYDNGVIRPTKTQDHTGSNIIEPSSDPTIFFGYNTETTEFGFRRLQVNANGITQLAVKGSLIDGFSVDMRSAGDKVFSASGVAVDGVQMRRLGTFGTSGLVRPDMAANRVYYLEAQSTYSSNYDKIGAYDPTTFSLIRRLTLPAAVTSPASLIRWGVNGLAFRTSNSIVLITSSQLVPSDPPADLITSVQATPNPATVGASLTYTVRVTNQGPNIARNTLLGTTLSDNQTLQSVVASTGTATTSGSIISFPIGDLAVGNSATLTITTSPQSAGSLTCAASVNSTSSDPNFGDNTGFKLVSVGFQSTIDIVNQLRLSANNLIYDPTRNLLWASIPATVEAPLGRSVVSINPLNGLISDPLSINANPMTGAMAISANGRYLYIGLSDSPEVHRIDLSAIPPTSVRIPLGDSQWGDANYAQDIEVLDGDGTSFLMAGTDDHGAAVYDGVTRRTNRTGIYTVDRVERTGSPGVFIGYNSYTSGFQLSRLSVTASGVSSTQSSGSVISGYYVDIHGGGDLVLSSSGRLVDINTLTLKASLGFDGRPCIDAPNRRAYLVNGNGLRGFDTTTYAAAGVLALPTTNTGDWAQTCIRWGFDGFAILGKDSRILIARWSSAIPQGADTNKNGIPDAWEATQLTTLNPNLTADPDRDGIPNAMEYVFGTSPSVPSANPMQFSASVVAASAAGLAVGSDTDDGAPTVIRLVYPRRVEIGNGSYGYEISSDLATWATAQNVNETVLSSTIIDGVPLEIVEALIPSPSPTSGFVRLKWLYQ